MRYYTKKALKNDVKSDDLDKAVYRIVKSFIEFGLYEEELPDNFNANVTSVDHQDFARKAVEESTILLKNENNALPLNLTVGTNILLLGNQAGDPTIHGWGSGQIGENYVYTPFEALCDAIGQPKSSSSWIPYDKCCNVDTQMCVTYFGLPRTNGKKLLGEEIKEEGVELLLSTEQFKELKSSEYTATIIFQGMPSGEGSDRSSLDWDQSVFTFLKFIKNPGTVIGSMVSPG